MKKVNVSLVPVQRRVDYDSWVIARYLPHSGEVVSYEIPDQPIPKQP